MVPSSAKGAGRLDPPIAQPMRVGQSFTSLRVIVESGAYCGIAFRGRAAANGAPWTGRPKLVAKSSAVTGPAVPSSTSTTNPSHDRPVQRSIALLGSPVAGIGTAWPGRPSARTFAPSGNRIAIELAPPGDKAIRIRLPLPAAALATSRAVASGVATIGAGAIQRVRPL